MSDGNNTTHVTVYLTFLQLVQLVCFFDQYISKQGN